MTEIKVRGEEFVEELRARPFCVEDENAERAADLVVSGDWHS